MKKALTLLLVISTLVSFSQGLKDFSSKSYKFPDGEQMIVPELDYSQVFIVFEDYLSAEDINTTKKSFEGLSLSDHSLPWPNKLIYDVDHKNDEGSYLEHLRSLPGVRSAYPSFILDGEKAFLDDQLIVITRSGQSTLRSIEDIISPYNAKVTEELDLISDKAYVVSVPAGINIFSLCNFLASRQEIIYAQPNFHFNGYTGFIPNDPMFNDQWFLNQASDADIDAPEAWDITTGSSSVAVAVIDGNGYDMAHSEMTGKYISPYNAVTDDNDPSANETDENHGTPCAGLIGALTNNSDGVASVGYNVKVIPIKMGYDFNGGSFSTSEVILIRACEHVMTSPYTVVAVSNSYSMGSWANVGVIQTAFSNMRTDSRGGLGAVVLASSGNDNALNSVAYPFHFASVVGVGSTDYLDQKSDFSNYGDSVDIAAPGSDTWTIDRSGFAGYSFTDYYEFSGTSAACPVAAGIVGLIGTVFPDYNEHQLRERLYASCEKVGGYSYYNNPYYAYGTWSQQLGYGRVNAFLAVSGGGTTLNPPTNLQASVSGNDVHLTWTPPGGGGGTQEELIYDNNINTGAYKYPGFAMSTHMSPSGPCQVLKLKYYTTNEGSDNQFYAKVFNWAGSQPGTTVLYNSTQLASSAGWVEVDVSGSSINVTGDFVVGFGSFTEQAYLGYDADYNNGRSWDFQESGQIWTSWNEAYLIRAVVLYPSGKSEELGGSIPEIIAVSNNNSERDHTGSLTSGIEPVPNQTDFLRGLQGYAVYRDGYLLNSTPTTNTYYDDYGLSSGTYYYTVKAVYDEGMSDPAGPVQATIAGTTLDPPTNLQSAVIGNSVSLSWTSPGGGGGTEWIYYHDGTFENSFASTDGGAGLAQLFTLTSYPVTVKELRFFTSDYNGWDQSMSVYVLSGDGNTILGGPFNTNGVSNNWVSITCNVTVSSSSFMIATYNDNADGPYVGVDNSLWNETLFFGNHTAGFTELSELGADYKFVGSHEAKVEYNDKSGKVLAGWIKPTNAQAIDLSPSMHIEKLPLSADYPTEKGLLGFNIYRDGYKINSSTWVPTTYQDDGLSNGTYAYTVTAVYSEGESAQTDPVYATINSGSLAAPYNLNGSINGSLVSLQWTSPTGGTEEELIYDNGYATAFYKYPGYTMASRMSPDGACQVMALKYYTAHDGSGSQFNAKVFNWAGSQPGTSTLYNSTVNTVESDWVEVDVSGSNIFVSGDFVVGFGSFTEEAFLGYDSLYNNGRSWDLDESGNSWSSWYEAYLIRAVVQYGDGSSAEIGGDDVQSKNINGLIGYNLYRNNIKQNINPIPGTSTTNILPQAGSYDFKVTAVYDEGESGPSNVVNFNYSGLDELEQIQVNIYPNPATEFINITSDKKIEDISLYSYDGTKLINKSEPAQQLKLDISMLAPGLYIVRIQNELGTAVAKLIVR